MSNNTRADGGSPSVPSNSSSDTHFGASVESQSQIEDAGRTGSDQGNGEPLNIYRLSPSAPPEDPAWENSPGHGEVVVAARTAGDARIVAASRELDFMEVDAAPAEGSTTSHASAFRSEKLYTVIEIDRGRRDVVRGVIEGAIGVDTIRPTQL
jgi:hypothetical protein